MTLNEGRRKNALSSICSKPRPRVKALPLAVCKIPRFRLCMEHMRIVSTENPGSPKKGPQRNSALSIAFGRNTKHQPNPALRRKASPDKCLQPTPKHLCTLNLATQPLHQDLCREVFPWTWHRKRSRRPMKSIRAVETASATCGTQGLLEALLP